MPRPAPPLAVSPSERMILEAVAASDEIPETVKKRARVVLLAADGISNSSIGQEVSLARPRVLYWRRRFLEQGIRGLWPVETVPPRERVSEDVEQAILEDCFSGARTGVWIDGDPSLSWNVRSLAKRHRVSPATVQRIFRKHGIEIERFRSLDVGIVLDQLKVSPDPLFGLTVYAIGGLFYETVGPVLALCCRERPFSELTLSPMSVDTRRDMVAGFVGRLRKLHTSTFGRPQPAAKRFITFLKAIQADPRHPGAQIHLVAHRPDTGAYVSPAVQAYLAQQTCIHLHCVPWNRRGRKWANLVERWLHVVAAWPMQTSFVETLFVLDDLFAKVPADQTFETMALVWAPV
jgi:Homeodomain-like domain